MRRLPSLLSAALALLVVLACLPAAASAASYSKRALSFDVTVGPNDDQTCRIVADLYVPNGVSKDDPAPAVMATNGFGGSKAEFDTLAPSYAARGYVFLSYSGLGFGNSGCKITLDDPDFDGKAGSQLVSFLGGSKAATDGTKLDVVQRDRTAHDGSHRSDDPRVGFIGGSYGGQNQFAIAGVDPRVDTIVPQITWNDLAYSLTPNNTDFERGVSYRTPGVVKLDWPVLFTALGLGQGFQQAVQNQDPSHVGACPNFTDDVCADLVTSGALGYPTDQTIALLRHASVASYLGRIRIPTFLIQGQSDTLFDLQEAVATYQGLFAQGTPVKMLWRSAGHSGGNIGTRENDEKTPERAYESRMALEWFDFYLRNTGEAPELSFGFLRDWALGSGTGDAAPAVGTTPTYPAGTDQPLYLSGSDGLVADRGAVKAGTASFAAVAGSQAGGGGSAVEVPSAPDPAGTSAIYTTAPLGDDFDLVGVPHLQVRVSAPTFAASQAQTGGKLVLFAKLFDVDPASGTATLPRNLISAVRVADVTKPIDIELPGVAHRFPRGHQIRLVLATSNETNRGNNVPGPVQITADPNAPQTLTLPRLGAQTGPDGSGQSGTTPFGRVASAPKQQRAGSGVQRAPAGSQRAARLPSNRRCVSRRAFVIHLRRPRHGDRLRSVKVTLNGKRVKVLRGKRLRSRISLRGLPKGTFHVRVVARTRKGRTLRASRTYHTCTPKRRS